MSEIIKTCKVCGAIGAVGIVFRYKHNACKDCERKAAKERMAAYYKTDAFKAWNESPAATERRKIYKQLARRAMGCRTREQIAAEALKREEEKERARLENTIALLEFVGPPKPSKKLLGEAGYFKWRYMNDVDFHMRQLDRAQAYKARTRVGYKESIVKWQNTPAALKELKHLQYLLTKAIERKQNENDK